MQETDLILKDILCGMLRKWRAIVIFAIICAMIVGALCAVNRVKDMNDEDKIELMQAEYEVAQGIYWAAIYDVDRQISENERLATMAENTLANFDNLEAEHKAQIEDLEAQIEYYTLLIEDYNANNELLLAEREKLEYYLNYRKEQNENSLLMAIDPYNVNIYEVYLRVDSGYEILPENTYQNIDCTAELLQTYRLLVGKTNFYDQMISDLKLNTEVRYLTEVISVSNYNTNSLCVRVMSDSAAWSKMVAEYVANTVLASHDHVKKSIADHEIIKYNEIAYAMVDLNIYSGQQNAIRDAFNYEESIRNVNTSILNNGAAIRDINTNIREFRVEIDQLNLAIDNLPLEKQAIEDEIATYRDANYKLLQKRIQLRETPEPTYGGYTTLSIITGFVKFAIIGGAAGAIIAAAYFVVVLLLGGKIMSSEQLCEMLQCEFFGYWPQTRKKFLGFVDRWIDRVADNTVSDMTAETATNLVLSNASVACDGLKKVMLCGGATKETIDEIAKAMKEQLPNVEVICGSTLGGDPAVVRGVAECDAVILVEQLDKSAVNAAMQLKNRAKSMNKPVLGVVLH